MKAALVVCLLIGSFAPLRAQQQWCFSSNCAEMHNPTLSLKQSKELGKVFRRVLALPRYTPIAPLAFSPATRQYFLNSAPKQQANPGLRLLRDPSPLRAIAGRNIGSVGADGKSGPQDVHPSFSTEAGGIVFRPTPRK
jgi:hypothetical protein